jgi:hypothetical protein
VSDLVRVECRAHPRGSRCPRPVIQGGFRGKAGAGVCCVTARWMQTRHGRKRHARRAAQPRRLMSTEDGSSAQDSAIRDSTRRRRPCCLLAWCQVGKQPAQGVREQFKTGQSVPEAPPHGVGKLATWQARDRVDAQAGQDRHGRESRWLPGQLACSAGSRRGDRLGRAATRTGKGCAVFCLGKQTRDGIPSGVCLGS